MSRALLFVVVVLLPACVCEPVPCEPSTAGLVAVSEVCPTIDLDACDPGPLDGSHDAACVVTVDRVCDGVTIGGRLGVETWDDAGCGYEVSQ